MAKIKPFPFFALPTELRLEVYRHLLTDTLANGRTSDAGGLYLASHNTHSEMKPLVSTVRVALDLKRAWDHSRRLKGRVKGKLCFEVPSIHTYSKPLTKLAISIAPDDQHITRFKKAKHDVLHHTENLAVLTIGLLLRPLGLEVQGRYSNKQVLTSQHLFFRVFLVTWGQKFLEQASQAGEIDRLTFCKDVPRANTWNVKIAYATKPAGFLHLNSVAYVSPWCSMDMVGARKRKRTWGVDFKGGLPEPGKRVLRGAFLRNRIS
jgi:hypothetical protein